jgi:hypothetical protein
MPRLSPIAIIGMVRAGKMTVRAVPHPAGKSWPVKRLLGGTGGVSLPVELLESALR